ncbi:MAG: phospho-sugar mutase [Bacteroidales bacterium]|nr:phospho-sugar mutase [Bacteroidales bacterium]
MEKTILDKINIWLNGNYDEKTKDEIRRMMAEDEKELTESFYKDLEFGTGGLRGIMGVGSNRMNKYTVGTATQGLANYIKLNFKNENLKVAIAHDSRNNSRFFAEVTAAILSANGIFCYLFEDLRPTPELSFTVRHLHCNAGIVITASHNPKEYNGYKVYWNDGGQLVPPHDKNVIAEVNKIASIDEILWTKNDENIKIIGEEVDSVYLSLIKGVSLNPDKVLKHKDLPIVYTPLHGTGITMVPKALKQLGFSNVTIVTEQSEPNGDFPTVKSPNPEEESAMEMALKRADEIRANLVLATDPDADRMGIAVRNSRGEMQLFNGNMTATLLGYYILSEYAKKGSLNDKFIVKTIVTTEMLAAMAKDFHIDYEDVLTGFKYIAEQIKRYEGKKQFIFGGEESYGTLVGDFVRDKDAVSACCMIAELAAVLAEQGKTLFDLLMELYQKYGYYKTKLVSLTKKGQDGARQIAEMMKNFRSNPPKTICNSKVLQIKDFKTSKWVDCTTGKETDMGFPSSDVLQFFTEDGSKITVRPSGTEPKIKFYFEVKGQLEDLSQFDEVDARLGEKIQMIMDAMF